MRYVYWWYRYVWNAGNQYTTNATIRIIIEIKQMSYMLRATVQIRSRYDLCTQKAGPNSREKRNENRFHITAIRYRNKDTHTHTTCHLIVTNGIPSKLSRRNESLMGCGERTSVGSTHIYRFLFLKYEMWIDHDKWKRAPSMNMKIPYIRSDYYYSAVTKHDALLRHRIITLSLSFDSDFSIW